MSSSTENPRTLTLEEPTKGQRKKGQPESLAPCRSTGPRTLRGRMKSRYNAIKHGIFASVVLRGSALREKKADYETLLMSFRESLKPEGGLEEFLVEKLAQLAWRKARAVKAEAAIVMKQTEFLRLDREARLRDNSQGDMLLLARLTSGTARCRENPYLLAKSVQVLEVLKNLISVRGFEPETDARLLESLYGENGKAEGLFFKYGIYSSNAKEASDKSPKPGPLLEEYKKEFLQALDAEVNELETQMADLEDREKEELPLLEESLAIPEDKELDRLLRYEARLDGAFDRTLQQVERLQRIRLGQPVPPTVKVDLVR